MRHTAHSDTGMCTRLHANPHQDIRILRLVRCKHTQASKSEIPDCVKHALPQRPRLKKQQTAKKRSIREQGDECDSRVQVVANPFIRSKAGLFRFSRSFLGLYRSLWHPKAKETKAAPLLTPLEIEQMEKIREFQRQRQLKQQEIGRIGGPQPCAPIRAKAVRHLAPRALWIPWGSFLSFRLGRGAGARARSLRESTSGRGRDACMGLRGRWPSTIWAKPCGAQSSAGHTALSWGLRVSQSVASPALRVSCGGRRRWAEKGQQEERCLIKLRV